MKQIVSQHFSLPTSNKPRALQWSWAPAMAAQVPFDPFRGSVLGFPYVPQVGPTHGHNLGQHSDGSVPTTHPSSGMVLNQWVTFEHTSTLLGIVSSRWDHTIYVDFCNFVFLDLLPWRKF